MLEVIAAQIPNSLQRSTHRTGISWKHHHNWHGFFKDVNGYFHFWNPYTGVFASTTFIKSTANPKNHQPNLSLSEFSGWFFALSHNNGYLFGNTMRIQRKTCYDYHNQISFLDSNFRFISLFVYFFNFAWLLLWVKVSFVFCLCLMLQHNKHIVSIAVIDFLIGNIWIQYLVTIRIPTP